MRALLAVAAAAAAAAAGPPQHAAIVLVDDLGYGDVGYAGAEYPTPSIDALAGEGVRLNQSYVMQLCSPTRTSLLTGRYSYNIGTDGNVLTGGDARCAPLDTASIADVLKAGGVATAAIGKWDNGYSSWACTPRCRGFDYWLGYYGAAEDYFLHGSGKTLDFHEDYDQAPQYRGEYSTQLFTRKAIEWLQRTAKTNSTFLYLAYQAVHGPLEAPDAYAAACMHITETNRRTYCAMMQALDEGMANLTAAYQALGAWDSTLLVFLADNGGTSADAGFNVPLRGQKATLWEGGVRAQTFIRWAGMPAGRAGTQYGGMVHVSDWLPTVASALLGAPPGGPLDGVDVWPALRDGAASPRTEMLLSMRDADLCGNGAKACAYPGQLAFRSGRYKLMYGHTALRGHADDCSWSNKTAPKRTLNCWNGWSRPYDAGPPRAPPALPPAPGQPAGDQVYSYGGIFLFDIEADPLEEHEISAEHPDVVKQLTARLAALNASHISQDVEKCSGCADDEKCGDGLQCAVSWLAPPAGGARCDPPSAAPTPPPGPGPAPPSPPGSCEDALRRVCPQPAPADCIQCCRDHKDELRGDGCAPPLKDVFHAYCNITASD